MTVFDYFPSLSLIFLNVVGHRSTQYNDYIQEYICEALRGLFRGKQTWTQGTKRNN